MYNHILIPVALDHEHPPAEALSVARRLLAEGGRITALNVLEPVPGFVAQYLPDIDHRQQVEDTRARIAEALGGAADVSIDIDTGNAGRVICDHAGDVGADLIVIASHRPGLQDYFLGSTAARVVRHAQCAVHVLR